MPAASYRAIRPRARSMVARVSNDRRGGVHFGGDAARNDVQNRAAEGDQQAIHELGSRGASVFARGFFQQRAVGVLLHGLKNQGRVGGCVGGTQRLHGFEIAGIGDYGGVITQGVKLAGHGLIRLAAG